MTSHTTRLLLAMALGLCGVTAAGCVVDEGSMLILGNTAIPADKCDDIQADEEGPFQQRGVLDLGLASRYVMFPTVRNQLASSSSVSITPGSTDTINEALIEGNDIQLLGAEVTFTAPANSGLVLPQSLFIPTSGTIGANGGVTPAAIEIISTALGSQLRASPIFATRGSVVTVLVALTLEGETTAGREVTSLEFIYPLDICVGCLVNFTPGVVSSQGGRLTCDPNVQPDSAAMVDIDPSPCFIGQDLPVDCRACWAGFPDEASAMAICDP